MSVYSVNEDTSPLFIICAVLSHEQSMESDTEHVKSSINPNWNISFFVVLPWGAEYTEPDDGEQGWVYSIMRSLRDLQLHMTATVCSEMFLWWLNLKWMTENKSYPHDVLYQQCFASLGNMSGNGCPKCDGAWGDEAWRAVLGPRWSEQT